MTDETQFCPACPTDMPGYRDGGQWVNVDGHEHPLPWLKPQVYQYDDTPDAHVWRAFLDVMTRDGWLGDKEFPTFAEAIEYATTTLVQIANARYTASAAHPATTRPDTLSA